MPLHPPLSVIITWPKPNLVNPETHGPARIACAAAMSPLIIIAVALRFYSRVRLTKNLGLDDWVIASAVLPTIAFNLVNLISDENYGGLLHVWDINPALDTGALKLFFASQILLGIVTPAIKFSILLFYRRLLEFMVGGAGISFFLLSILQCLPVKASWDPLPTYPYHCLSEWWLETFTIINAVNDFLLLVIPIPIIWGLQMHYRRRIAVIILFSLSFIACICGIIRTVYFREAVTSYDISWTIWTPGVSTILELNLGIVCASAPALRPLVVHYFPLLLEGPGHGSGRKNPKETDPESIRLHRIEGRNDNSNNV